MIDIEQPNQLLDYLQQMGHIAANESVCIQPLSGGVSNRTMLVERETGRDWIVKQALEKLRVQVDWFSEPERIHREALAIRMLGQIPIPPPGTIPGFVFEDFEHHLLAIEAVPQPAKSWKEALLAGELTKTDARDFGRTLATIHREAYNMQALGEDGLDFKTAFADQHFFETLRLEPYYRYSAKQVPVAASFLDNLIDSLEAHTFVHGDFSPKNILLDRQIGMVVIDYEVAHWGDPAFDIGFSMTHLLSKAHFLSSQRAAFREAAHTYWNTYTTLINDMPWRNGLEVRAAHHTLGCLLARVAGRSQLEYLDHHQKDHQRRITLGLMKSTPNTMPELIDLFVESL